MGNLEINYKSTCLFLVFVIFDYSAFELLIGTTGTFVLAEIDVFAIGFDHDIML